MKILITGSAGYLGKNLVSKSLERNFEVVGLDIKNSGIYKPKFFEEICDITKKALVHEVIHRHKPEIVIHCAGALAQFVPDEKQMHEINVGGIQILLEESWNHRESVKKFVFISSVEVYGIDVPTPCLETAPMNPICQYGEDKVECEGLCKKYLDKGMDITIFRPPTITGPGQNEPTLLGQIINAYKGKRAFLPGGGKTKLQMVNVFDVCEAIFLAIENPASKGEIFNLGSDNVPILREMVITLYKHAEKKPKYLALGAGILRFIVKILDLLHISPIEPQHLEIALKDYTFDSTKIKTILGWQPTRTDSESACDTYDWYVNTLQKEVKIKMLKAVQFEDLYIITMGRGIFGQYVYPVYSYLLEDLLIDTGTKLCQLELLEFLKDKELNMVINTHAHEDHIGNNAILQEKRGVRVYAHKDAISRIENPALLNLRGYQKLIWGLPSPSKTEEIPSKLKTKSHKLEIIHTPGHAPEHICIYEPKKKWLFTGDLHVGKLSLETQPFDNLQQIMESLKTLTKYDVNEIFCSHEGHISNGNAAIEKKLKYLEDAKALAEQLFSEHVPLPKIVEHVAGKETLMKTITRGHMSKLNGIKSLLNIT